MVSCRQARLEVKRPTRHFGGKNKALDIEQFLRVHPWLILCGGNAGLKAPAVEQDPLVGALLWWLQGERRVGGAAGCSSRFLLDSWTAWCSILHSDWSSTPWALSSSKELLQRGTSVYGLSIFWYLFYGRVVVLPSAAVSAKPGSPQSSFLIGDFCPKYRTW